MIVKTGANYQAEGGYIEASKTGSTVNIKTDGRTYDFKSDADMVTSLYKTKVSLAPALSTPIYCIGLRLDNDKLTPITSNITNVEMERYASENVAIYMAIGGTTGIENPTLSDGSNNTIIEKKSATSAVIYSTGPNAVAIIKEAE